MKVHVLHYANELLGRIRLSFQTRSNCRNNKKKCLEKTSDEFSLSIRVQTTIKHISICFLPLYQRQRKRFLSERELKKALRDTLTRAAWLDSYRQWQISQSNCEISCKKKDGGCTFYHNTLRTKLSPLGNAFW